MEIIYIRNKNTEEVHKCYKEGLKRFSLEVCNVDDIIDFDIITEEQALATVFKERCGHCFTIKNLKSI